jgi:hypothetical protein
MTDTPTIERDARPSVGPSFLEIDGEVKFQYVIDSGNIIGPRKATDADKAEHGDAWRWFSEGRLPQPIRPVSDEHVHEPADYEQLGGATTLEAPRRGRPPKPKD